MSRHRSMQMFTVKLVAREGSTRIADPNHWPGGTLRGQAFFDHANGAGLLKQAESIRSTARPLPAAAVPEATSSPVHRCRWFRLRHGQPAWPISESTRIVFALIDMSSTIVRTPSFSSSANLLRVFKPAPSPFSANLPIPI